MFNLLVLIVNLNLYCSSEALDVRGNHLYCVCLTSVNYGHCGFRARWSCISIHRKFQHESSVFAERLPRGQASLQTKITWQVDESPFLIRELTFKTTNKWNIPYGKKKKNAVSLLIDTNIRVLLYVQSFVYSLCNGRLDVSLGWQYSLVKDTIFLLVFH